MRSLTYGVERPTRHSPDERSDGATREAKGEREDQRQKKN